MRNIANTWHFFNCLYDDRGDLYNNGNGLFHDVAHTDRNSIVLDGRPHGIYQWIASEQVSTEAVYFRQGWPLLSQIKLITLHSFV